MRKLTLKEKFWDRIRIDFKTGCWIWEGPRTPNGYPTFSTQHIPQYAHRFMYERVKGRILVGYEIHHTCENESCVKPGHLSSVRKDKHPGKFKGFDEQRRRSKKRSYFKTLRGSK